MEHLRVLRSTIVLFGLSVADESAPEAFPASAGAPFPEVSGALSSDTGAAGARAGDGNELQGQR